MKQRRFWMVMVTGLVFTWTRGKALASLILVENGKSDYSIVVPKVAAKSVNDAADELQMDIEKATGAKLPMVKDDQAIEGPFLSVGHTQQAKAADVTSDGLEPGGYRIATQGNNLYFIGMDTTTENLSRADYRTRVKAREHPEIPGPAYTQYGGFSRGSANGVYRFLERQLGVRWLFSGDLGRVVPKTERFTIDAINHTFEPKFDVRTLSRHGSDDWRDRMGLGYSFRNHSMHNFVQTVPASLWKKHPDWFAMNAKGERPKPRGGYKLETTNPELVQYFAEQAIAAMRADPHRISYSLSPSDSWGWSQSPASKALYDPVPPGGRIPSMTRLVMKFYRDVSAIVAKEYPKGILGGMIYSSFSYPPADGNVTMPPNFIPTYVSYCMGYNFYMPEVRRREAFLLDAWSKGAMTNDYHRWYFYAMPTWVRNGSAMILPAAPKELNFLYHHMVKVGIKGGYMYSVYKDSQTALVNYVNAKMLWDPTADATAIQHDWLVHAYGQKAGVVMETFYNKLDESWWADFFRSPESTHYNNSEAMFRDTYGKYYPQMEAMFLKAWAQPMTQRQKQRLDLIRQNMIALQWRLRNAGYLPTDYQSPLKRNTRQIWALLTDPKTKENFIYTTVGRAKTISEQTIRIGKPSASPDKAGASQSKPPNANCILLYPAKNGKVTLKPTHVQPGSTFLVYYLQNAEGKTLDRGILDKEQFITFNAKANQPYYFWTQYNGIVYRPRVKWSVAVEGAAAASGIYQDDVLYLQPEDGKSAAVYVFVPDGLKWMVNNDKSGVVFGTESDQRAASHTAWQAGKDAKKALADALKKHDAGVVTQLDNRWKFHPDPDKIGIKEGYFKSDFNDEAWKSISTLGRWQSHGFPKYQGTAWYRKTFKVSSDVTDPLAHQDSRLLLFFGAVDGDAFFYLNGQEIGRHGLYEGGNGWEAPIALDVTDALQAGQNTIAVKVTKNKFVGGIYRGVSLLSAKK